jgi:hypothetical protein
MRVLESETSFSLLFALQYRHTSRPSNIDRIGADAVSQKQKSIRAIYNKYEKTPGVAARGFNTGVVG